MKRKEKKKRNKSKLRTRTKKVTELLGFIEMKMNNMGTTNIPNTQRAVKFHPLVCYILSDLNGVIGCS